jgi:hypothetical protein
MLRIQNDDGREVDVADDSQAAIEARQDRFLATAHDALEALTADDADAQRMKNELIRRARLMYHGRGGWVVAS